MNIANVAGRRPPITDVAIVRSINRRTVGHLLAGTRNAHRDTGRSLVDARTIIAKTQEQLALPTPAIRR